jgi:lipoate-protein ligase A
VASAPPAPPARQTVRTLWHVLVDADPRAGAVNMAIDQALLDDVERTGRSFLRLYRWSPPCLSLGRHEPALARYDRAAIERRGVDVVRRPTGGRAVWHDAELTYAVAAPVAAFGSLRDSYRAIHERLAAALRTLGAPAELAPDAGHRTPVTGPCFAGAIGGEIVVRGRKVVGSAQVRQGGALLQHGSILLDGSQDVVRAVTREPGASARDTTLSAVLGRPLAFGEVADAVVAAWAAPVRHAPVPTVPPLHRFSDPAWTWRR